MPRGSLDAPSLTPEPGRRFTGMLLSPSSFQIQVSHKTQEHPFKFFPAMPGIQQAASWRNTPARCTSHGRCGRWRTMWATVPPETPNPCRATEHALEPPRQLTYNRLTRFRPGESMFTSKRQSRRAESPPLDGFLKFLENFPRAVPLRNRPPSTHQLRLNHRLRLGPRPLRRSTARLVHDPGEVFGAAALDRGRDDLRDVVGVVGLDVVNER